MAKPVKQTKKPMNSKAVAAVTLVVLLALTLAAAFIGVRGMNLDNQGLYKLLAWIPTPSQSSTWRQALVPGADLGENLVQTYTAAPVAEGGEVTEEQLKQTVSLLGKRLAFGGWNSAQAEVIEGNKIRLTLPLDGTHDHAFEMMAQRGDFAFAAPDGTPFLTWEHVKQANYGLNPQDGSYAIGFLLDNEGKQIFADKTAELIGQSMQLMIDGTAVANPGINQALTEGQASLPGFNNENSVAYASMMQYGPLPLVLTHESNENGAPLFGAKVQNTVIWALAAVVLLISLYFLFTYRLGGLIAVWLMGIQLVAAYFLAALVRSGFTVATLLAVWGSFGLLVYALLLLYRSMKSDLDRGRAIRQSVKDAYAGPGKVAIDVLAALLLLAVILIIVDHQQIGAFMRTFGLGVLVDLVLMGIVMRILMSNAINLFGTNSALYTSGSAKKEAA